MNQETDSKIEIIIISVINRLFSKEENIGLDIEDLKALEIICKISKDAKVNTSSLPISTPETPENLIDLLRAARGESNDNR